MRLFIALSPPPDITAAVARMQQTLAHTRADVRWTDPAHLHVTVKFLGETDEALLPEIVGRLTAAAAQVPQFPLEVEGVSRLPPKGPPRVIISRILSPDQRLTKLHRLIDSALGGMGLPMDTRALTPHLTLGRVSSNHGLNRLLRLVEKHDLDFFGSFTVEQATLFRSHLEAQPADRYRALHSAALAQGAPQPLPPSVR
ncbi:MAG TPA: RNA 2',3'-cyclic phosphodiesterase [Phycisphaerae bacterium]|nr:RNA 2',3'-cyclic phosphodiesterase [Phycisphaerae bacterium]